MATIDVQGQSFDEARYQDRISAKAYEIWEAEGRPQGGHERHWDQARNIVIREAAEENSSSEKPAAEEAGARQDEDEPTLPRSARARRSRQPSAPR